MTAEQAIERIRHLCDMARGERHEWDGEPVVFVHDLRLILAAIDRA